MDQDLIDGFNHLFNLLRELQNKLIIKDYNIKDITLWNPIVWKNKKAIDEMCKIVTREMNMIILDDLTNDKQEM